MPDSPVDADSIRKAAEYVKQLGEALAAAVQPVKDLVGQMRSMQRIGLEGTGALAMMNFQTQQLGRSIAAVFLPAVEAATKATKILTDFFRQLTLSQQHLILGLAEGVGAVTILGTAFRLLGVQVGIATGGLSILVGAVTAFLA